MTIREQAAYLARVCEAIAADDEAVMQQLSPVCADCAEEAIDCAGYSHVMFNAWVLIGCFGTRQIEAPAPA